MIENDEKSDSKAIVELEEEPSSRVPKECSRGHSQIVEIRRTTYDIFYGCRGMIKVRRPESNSHRMLSQSVKESEHETQSCDWVEKVQLGQNLC